MELDVSVKQLLEAGVHFGHQTKRWNPKMRSYIFEERNGIYIVDLEQSVGQLEKACAFASQLASRGQSFLFVGTKKQAQESIVESAKQCGAHYVSERWLGGTLTNIATIRNSVKRLIALEQMDAEGIMKKLSKKEASSLRREKLKLLKNLSGVKEMEKPPACIFVVDTVREHIAIAEARKLKIPIIAIIDTNADPEEVDYIIAGNDDAIKAIRLITFKLSEAINKGRKDFVPEEEAKEEEKKEVPSTSSGQGEKEVKASAEKVAELKVEKPKEKTAVAPETKEIKKEVKASAEKVEEVKVEKPKEKAAVAPETKEIKKEVKASAEPKKAKPEKKE